jgi:hypothetical protein
VRNPVWSSLLDAIAPQGLSATWHFGASLVLVTACVLYALYLVLSGEKARVALRRRHLSLLLPGLAPKLPWRDKRLLAAANAVCKWFVFISLGTLIASGLAIHRLDWALDEALGGYDVARRIHGLSCCGLLTTVAVHLGLLWRIGRLWSIFRVVVRRNNVPAGFLATATAGAVAFALWSVDGALPTLRVVHAQGIPVIDGVGDDDPWRAAEEIAVVTAKGVGFHDSKTRIRVAAIHDGERIYFRFRWQDATRSAKRYPLIKRADGWHVLGERFAIADETHFYEDKLAVSFATKSGWSCANTCHLGSDPAGFGTHSVRGLHYTAGDVVDLWHWKLSRTNNMDRLGTGFMDDQHIGTAAPPIELEAHYLGGRNSDPRSGGGYRSNFVCSDSANPPPGGTVLPKRIAYVKSPGTNLDADISDAGVWWIHEGEGVPYAIDLDTYPNGTVLPGVLVTPFTGSRGDVTAKGAWENGTWTLEASRLLDTGDTKHDVAFELGRSMIMSVAAFDHSQTRHSEHIHPVRLQIEARPIASVEN